MWSMGRYRVLVAIALFVLTGSVWPSTVVAETVPVSVTITGGQLSVSLTPTTAVRGIGAPTGAAYSATTQVVRVPIGFVVDDARMASVPAGWRVVASATDLIGPGGAVVPAAGMRGQVSTIVVVSGSAAVPQSAGLVALDQPQPVLTAPAGQGEGRYEATLDVSITVPAYTRPGTYAGQVLITMVSAP